MWDVGPALCLNFVHLRAISPIFAALLCGAGVSFAQAGGGFEGRTVARIDFEPPGQPLPIEELERRIDIRQGMPLHLADVRASIQELYRTGHYSDRFVPLPGLSRGLSWLIRA